MDAIHILLSKILKGHFKSPKLSNFALSKNTEDKAKQPLALAYILHLYKLHGSYISDWELGTQKVENHWKIVRYIIFNTRREMLVLLNF